MERQALTIETFLAVCEMVAAQLRIKSEDRWSQAVCELRWASFQAQFPEVDASQFLWSAEQYLQGRRQGFQEFPSWGQLVAPLYRTEAGLANRSWGFREDLPPFVQPTIAQLQALPSRSVSVLPLPPGADPAAYRVVAGSAPPALPPAAEVQPLTEEQFQRFLAGEDVEAPPPPPPKPPPAVRRAVLPLLSAAELAQAEAAVRRSRP
jgi:uncharacterized membrane protein YhdT